MQPNGDLALMYCNHPFTWSSSNTSLAIRRAGSDTYEHQTHDLMSHGPVWDIANLRRALEAEIAERAEVRIHAVSPVSSVGSASSAPAARARQESAIVA